MKIIQKISILFIIGWGISLLSVSTLCAQKKEKPSKKDSLIILSTSFGDMTIVLYQETPKHRNNLLKLANEGFYDSLLFHRVIKEFMIQGGDPNSKNAPQGRRLGAGGLSYKVDAEFHPDFYHKKGALAAARDNNYKKASNGCQFYIVQGKKATDIELDRTEKRNKFTYTKAQREVYKTIGGTPFLDQSYTVYGEVIDGLDVIDKITSQAKDRYDRPIKNIRMAMKVKVMKKKKITKMYGYTY